MSDLSELAELETNFKSASPNRTRKQVNRDLRGNASTQKRAKAKRKLFGQPRHLPVSVAPISFSDDEVSR